MKKFVVILIVAFQFSGCAELQQVVNNLPNNVGLSQE